MERLAEVIEELQEKVEELIEELHEKVEELGEELQQKVEGLGEELQMELQEQKTMNENKPLTIEQLKHMDGEPVWIVTGDKEGTLCNVIKYATQRVLLLTDGTEVKWDFYNVIHEEHGHPLGLHKFGWIAYRHKPKEVERCKD